MSFNFLDNLWYMKQTLTELWAQITSVMMLLTAWLQAYLVTSHIFWLYGADVWRAKTTNINCCFYHNNTVLSCQYLYTEHFRHYIGLWLHMGFRYMHGHQSGILL